jgi:hypothetical protein
VPIERAHLHKQRVRQQARIAQRPIEQIGKENQAAQQMGAMQAREEVEQPREDALGCAPLDDEPTQQLQGEKEAAERKGDAQPSTQAEPILMACGMQRVLHADTADQNHRCAEPAETGQLEGKGGTHRQTQQIDYRQCAEHHRDRCQEHHHPPASGTHGVKGRLTLTIATKAMGRRHIAATLTIQR